jgi:hypothetical protein
VDRAAAMAGDAHRAVADFVEANLPAAGRSPAAGPWPGVIAAVRPPGASPAGPDGITPVVMPVAIANGVGAATEADTTGEAGLGASASGGTAQATTEAVTIRGITGAVTTPLITTPGIMATPTTGMIHMHTTRMLMTRTLMITTDTMEPRFALPEAWPHTLV